MCAPPCGSPTALCIVSDESEPSLKSSRCPRHGQKDPPRSAHSRDQPRPRHRQEVSPAPTSHHHRRAWRSRSGALMEGVPSRTRIFVQRLNRILNCPSNAVAGSPVARQQQESRGHPQLRVFPGISFCTLTRIGFHDPEATPTNRTLLHRQRHRCDVLQGRSPIHCSDDLDRVTLRTLAKNHARPHQSSRAMARSSAARQTNPIPPRPRRRSQPENGNNRDIPREIVPPSRTCRSKPPAMRSESSRKAGPTRAHQNHRGRSHRRSRR